MYIYIYIYIHIHTHIIHTSVYTINILKKGLDDASFQNKANEPDLN